MYKIFFVTIFFVELLNATQVGISIKNIKYKETLKFEDFKIVNVDFKLRCKVFDLSKLKNSSYQSTHYIREGKPLCIKDAKAIINNKISYDFGNIIIQRAGKVISENKRFIRIKNSDGSVEKIFKNGQYK